MCVGSILLCKASSAQCLEVLRVPYYRFRAYRVYKLQNSVKQLRV